MGRPNRLARPLSGLALLALATLALPRSAPAESLAAEVARRVEDHRARWGTPGVAVAIVEQGRVAHLGGYGFADLASVRPVDPASTVFPLFSVSKVFTAVLALQEVEAGRLALCEDVAPRLPAGLVPADSGTPITLHHLLTHSSGLDERLLGMTEAPGREPPGLEPFLARWLPARVRPPGEAIQYSIGYGTSLAGLLVERAAGRPFAELATTRILAPLGMASSAPGWSPWMAGRDATGYLPGPGRTLLRVPRAVLRVAPAGGIHATAADMARFMVALLPAVGPPGARLLSPASLAAMCSPQATPHPGFPGLGYGLFLRPGGGEHAGGPLPHLCCLTLLPGAGVGIFFASNSPTGIFLIRELNDALARGRYRVVPPVLLPGPPGDGPGAARLAGTWRSTWVDRHGPFALNALSPAVPEIELAARDGEIVAVHPASGLRETWVPGPPGLFLRPAGRGPVAFVPGEGGRPDRLFLHPLLPVGHFVFTFERIPWYATRRVLVPLEAAVLALLAALALGLPLAALRARLGLCPAPPGSPAAALAAALVLVAHGAPLAALLACRGPAGLGGLAELSGPARLLLRAGAAGLLLAAGFLGRQLVAPCPQRVRRRLEGATLAAGVASLAAWGLLDPVP